MSLGPKAMALIMGLLITLIIAVTSLFVIVGVLYYHQTIIQKKIAQYDKLVEFQKEFNAMSQNNFEVGAESLKSLDKATDDLKKKLDEINPRDRQ